jgi:hypothetical protein
MSVSDLLAHVGQGRQSIDVPGISRAAVKEIGVTQPQPRPGGPAERSEIFRAAQMVCGSSPEALWGNLLPSRSSPILSKVVG